MFEAALMESSHSIKTSSKYWSLPALAVNCGVLCALILWPLLHPEALPRQVLAALLVAPPAPPTPPPTIAVRTQAQSNSVTHLFDAPSQSILAIPTAHPADEPEAFTGINPLQDTNGPQPGNPMSSLVSGMGHTSVVKALPPAKTIVSSGVMAGRLMKQTTPPYPAIAKATRTQGTVVLLATIAKNGGIENLRVLSGPPMLQQAALEAVRSWRYQPYLLNGEPVEVETTINIIFNLGAY